MPEPYVRRSDLPYTASQIFSLFADEKDAAFLDSSLENKLGRYAIIGLVPYHTVTVEKGRLRVDGKYHPGSAEAYLKDYLRRHGRKNYTDLPLTSGAIGYVTYDYGMKGQGLLSQHAPKTDIAEMKWVFYDFFIIEDLKDHSLWFIANGHTEEAPALWDKMESLIGQRMAAFTQPSLTEIYPAAIRPDCTPDEYALSLRKLMSYLVSGDVYVTNFTSTLTVDSPCPPYTLFSRLRRDNPSPFGAYLQYGNYQIVSSSMERLLHIDGRRIETRPIKGTRRRGKTAAEDTALRQELKDSQKDRSELLMIVDLERNDLHKICQPGSVTVPALFTVEDYASVFHLVASVTGILLPDQTAVDALTALFPGGSVTGAPKKRAMEIIDELEASRRQLYTGTIGYLSLDGNCDLNIVIRTAVHQKDTYYIGVGGGITAESDRNFEYEEIWQKAKALLTALKGEPFYYEPYL
ncbi:aminodeoxychorismate synthase component I [uncultured Megasphaera sp.]|uniref:aminodeoxychorismate synthase component I n=1 Tax=uncultured Megasphaera sp. TaxID=165188 RepID=UPI0025F09FD6|nr:aminodeoxychorismate synthase component I [uncultured Megasphaera sp.]